MSAALVERTGVVVKRRKVLGGLLAGGMGIFGIVAIFPLLRSLGPLPGQHADQDQLAQGHPPGRHQRAAHPRATTSQPGRDRHRLPRRPPGQRRQTRPSTRRSSSGRRPPTWSPRRAGRDWAPDGLRGLLQAVHPPRLPGRPLRAGAASCWSARATSRCSTSGDGAVPAVRPGAPPAAPAAPLHRPARLPPGPGRLRPAGRARASGSAPSRTARHDRGQAPDQARGQGRPGPLRPGRPGRRRARRPPRRRQGRPDLPRQDLPGPLVVHARRDRPVLLRRPAGHRRLPHPVLRALARPRWSTTASTSPCDGTRMSEAYASTVNLSLLRARPAC